MVMSFFAGLGASAAFPLILSFSARFPRWHAGVVFSAVIMAGALGRIVFPYLVGPLAESLGFRIALCLTFVLSAALSLLALYLYRVSGEVPAACRGRVHIGVAGRRRLVLYTRASAFLASEVMIDEGESGQPVIGAPILRYPRHRQGGRLGAPVRRGSDMGEHRRPHSQGGDGRPLDQGDRP